MYSLSERITALCNQNNISVNLMLKECGLPSSTFRNIVQGSKPSFDKVEKIADYFGCSVDYLLGRTDQISPANPDASPDQRELLTIYESLDSEGQQYLLQAARMAQSNFPVDVPHLPAPQDMPDTETLDEMVRRTLAQQREERRQQRRMERMLTVKAGAYGGESTTYMLTFEQYLEAFEAYLNYIKTKEKQPPNGGPEQENNT